MTMHERTGFASVLGGLVLAVFLLFLAKADSVSAAVPSAVPFQGLLLDTAGQPVTDNVDLDFALFAGLSGGTALWSESHLGVAVTDGVYSADLGSTTPIDAAVLAAGPVFLEIKVEGETLVPRQQLLAVPYARVAETVERVGDYSSLYLEQILAGVSFDGGLPENNDPLEGTGDLDGDGRPNFLDSDNDNDGYSDGEEITLGRPVNLPDPRLVSVTPNTLTSYVSASLLVQGTNLSTVQSVLFGSAPATPTDITATSFRIQVTPDHLAPSSRTVSATIANGQSAESPPVAITNLTPTITSIAPTSLIELQATQVVIQGTNFIAGTVVEADALSLTPSAITATSITVTIPPRPVGVLTLRVVHPNGLSASTTMSVYSSVASKTVFLTQTTFGGTLGGLAGADATCQAEANAAGLPGSFRAWLSDSTTAAASRVAVTTGRYRMPNGVFVANSWTDLTDGSLLAGINSLANGTVVAGSGRVWTATHNDGTAYSAAADNCNNWTSNSGTGRQGLFNLTNVWTDFAPSSPCSTIDIRLYCFEQ